MAIPTLISFGGATGTGAVSPAWPTSPPHQAGDISLLFVESANEAVTLSTPAGFVEVTGSPQFTGTTGAAAATRITLFWCRATSSSMATPTVADPGNHVYAQHFVFRGCIATGDPWDVTSGGNEAASDTSWSAPGATTSVADCLVVIGVTLDTDISTARWGASCANADLSSFTATPVADSGTALGTGGCLAVMTGGKAAAGAYGATTGTCATAATKAWMTVALKPAVAVLDDALDQPFAARRRVTAWGRTLRAVSHDGVDYYPAVDDFNRGNGSPVDSAHPWLLIGGAGAINTNQLSLPSAGDLLWNAVFPADQQASVVWANANWPSQALLYLKVQGTTTSSTSHIGAYYDDVADQFVIETWDATNLFVTRGTLSGVVLAAGDTITVRADPAGSVTVFRNGALLGTVSVTGWPDFAKTGRIGLGWWGTNVTTFRADDFGGGVGAIQAVAADTARDLLVAGRRRDLRGTRAVRPRVTASDPDTTAGPPPPADDPIQDLNNAARRGALPGKVVARAATSDGDTTAAAPPPPEDASQDLVHAARRLGGRGSAALRPRAASSDETGPPGPTPDDPLQDVVHAARRKDNRLQAPVRIARAQSSEGDTPETPQDPLQDSAHAQDGAHAARRRALRANASVRVIRAQTGEVEAPVAPVDDPLGDVTHAARRRDTRGQFQGRLQRALSSEDFSPLVVPDDPLTDSSHAARRRDLRGVQAGLKLRVATSESLDPTPAPPPDDPLQDVVHAARRRDLRGARVVLGRVALCGLYEDFVPVPDEPPAPPSVPSGAPQGLGAYFVAEILYRTGINLDRTRGRR